MLQFCLSFLLEPSKIANSYRFDIKNRREHCYQEHSCSKSGGAAGSNVTAGTRLRLSELPGRLLPLGALLTAGRRKALCSALGFRRGGEQENLWSVGVVLIPAAGWAVESNFGGPAKPEEVFFFFYNKPEEVGANRVALRAYHYGPGLATAADQKLGLVAIQDRCTERSEGSTAPAMATAKRTRRWRGRRGSGTS